MTRERNRACRIAYGHARRGNDTLAYRWIGVAELFAEPTPKQIEHVERLLREARPVIPGQFDIYGKEAGMNDMEAAQEMWDRVTEAGPPEQADTDEKPEGEIVVVVEDRFGRQLDTLNIPRP